MEMVSNMRALAILAVLALVTAPVLAAPEAYADGIERPRPPQRARPRPRPAPVAPAPEPAPVVIERGPETVTLPESFFASTGGVGADVGAGAYSGTTVIVRGGSASTSAFAYASARSSARAGNWGGGGHGGGCGCR